MAFLSKFLGGKSGEAQAAEEISEIVPLSQCPATCSAAECFTRYPNSYKDDPGSKNDLLWKSTKPYSLHIIIPTGKSDWKRDATDVDGTILKSISHWASSTKLVPKAVKVSTSSIPQSNAKDPRIAEQTAGDILILPYFVWVKQLCMEDVDAVLDELVPILFSNFSIETTQVEPIDIPAEIKGYEIVKDTNKSYVFLCSHKTRDKRCGITAPIIKKEMCIHLRDHDLYRDLGDDRPGGVQVHFINHVGGHKYAANVLIYLKSGANIWLARCNPFNVKPIIEETILGGGKVWPEHVRLVQKSTKPLQW
ncbi:Actin patches distal protein [Komagataella phaffii CBS 7435]|uniref:Actin patches distal protein 1 n=2 Tax=Komagataella phaffii TaxID=460519 RepID=C4QWA1_KOMPG|nr:uncharacterized protein PAS_chr1-1_0159 [Komagataella phaffii GS115]AOA61192.1 GQ67_02738T0 [Komagataella phaffii]CAH2446194.1 Actin patches distal protein [Komagataella phaffii CBS 7435]AOA65460.1 GQ68_02510T0 [Komagataella phaffii GS115]CAY67524.1 Protein of unknown function, required for normal localization of actin patches [Komagataella phaffii GS115]SCV11808.1 Actin patches distal protein [Komagataella phaffii CBS 7435]